MVIEKYHASGNDFLIGTEKVKQMNVFVKKICSRHTSIGADGFILIDIKEKRIQFYNADGSDASMCGNGCRVIGAYLSRHQLWEKDNEYLFIIGNYQVRIKRIQENPTIVEVTLPYSTSKIEKRRVDIFYKKIDVKLVNVGNSHAVIEVNHLPSIYQPNVLKASKKISSLFDANVNYVQKIDSKNIKVLTYERGVGFTLCCGTGSLASGIILNKENKIQDTVSVLQPLGSLTLFLKENKIRGSAHFIAEIDTYEL